MPPPPLGSAHGSQGSPATSSKKTPSFCTLPPSGTKLLDRYTLGKVLGQGAFGVVYKCRKRGTNEEFAVKMIDQVETPLAEIKMEVEVLQKLEHEYCIRCIEVFYEKVFACVVMPLYPGGDMIQGMMAHWQTKGMIPIANVSFLAKQMCAGVAWISSLGYVHRDIKGDNFMMQESGVENAKQRVFLSDFGTVRFLAKDARFNQKCGTKNYWSPEFYRMNYGHMVDPWAVGVIMYGLVSGKFPFKSEEDVRKKVLVIPDRCPEEGQQIIRGLLERDENKRTTAEQALQTPWIKSEGSVVGASQGRCSALEEKPDMKFDGANGGVALRRMELVGRLKKANIGAVKSPRGHVMQRYTVVDPMTERGLTFEWVKEELSSPMVATFKTARKLSEGSMPNDEVTSKSVQESLQEHNISVDSFGKAPAVKFDDFVSELRAGESCLLLDATKHKFMVRSVQIVVLKVSFDNDPGRVLVDVTPGLQEGMVTTGPSLPQGIKLAHENALQAALRLEEELLRQSDCLISWDVTNVEEYEETIDLPAYPGITTVYQKRMLKGTIKAKDQDILRRVGKESGGYSHRSSRGPKSFQWLTLATCKEKKARTEGCESAVDFSAMVYPPTGLQEEALQNFMRGSGIDTDTWGTGTFKTLEDFSDELTKGASTLIKYKGQPTRLVDIVILYLHGPDGKVLMEAEEDYKGNVQVLNRLPAVKRRSDEHQFNAARRAITQYLKLDDNGVIIDEKDVRLLEEVQESKAYPGLKTIYRKRLITGTVHA